MCETEPPTPGGWKDTIQRLRADFNDGRAKGAAYLAPREQSLAADGTLSVCRAGTAGAAAITVIQCETLQFGLMFALVWLTGIAPATSVAAAGYLSGRMVAAMNAALISRAVLRPIRLLAELCTFALLHRELRGLDQSGCREVLSERLLKTAAVLLALVMTVRAFDLNVLPGGTVGILPASARDSLLAAGECASAKLTSGMEAARTIPLLRSLVQAIEFDGQIATVMTRLFEAAGNLWSTIEPVVLRWRRLIFK
eukprot:4250573-Prymnesium_polylepis.2